MEHILLLINLAFLNVFLQPVTTHDSTMIIPPSLFCKEAKKECSEYFSVTATKGVHCKIAAKNADEYFNCLNSFYGMQPPKQNSDEHKKMGERLKMLSQWYGAQWNCAKTLVEMHEMKLMAHNSTIMKLFKTRANYYGASATIIGRRLTELNRDCISAYRINV